MVCTVWVDDVDVSLAQLRAGLAWHFKRYASEQTPSDRETYALAEVEARAAHLGLWSDESPIAPWDWRHMKSGSTVGPSGYPISMMVFAIDNSKVGAPTLSARPRRYRQP
jgi:endonuclease YncB( thermonuclease family)